MFWTLTRVNAGLTLQEGQCHVRYWEKMKKHNTYGVLITVVSLLFIIIYSSEGYDQWDMLISILAAYFGISYLISGQYYGWFSGFLASVISVVGVLVGIISLSSIIQSPVSKLEVFSETVAFYSFSWLFLITIGLSLVISILMKIKNTKQRH